MNSSWKWHPWAAAAIALTMLAPAHAESAAPAADGRAERLLERLDTDGDGFLSLDEFREPRRGAGPFAAADSDGDGAVTLAELEARIDAKAEAQRLKAREHFAKADIDGDGSVTAAERKAAQFALLDSDADGLLAAEELAARPPRPPRPERPARPGRS